VKNEMEEGKEVQKISIDTNSVKNRGKIVRSEIIKFDRVPLISPNGDVMIKEMSFEIQEGMHVMIAGPNGCGKSSLFRILGELWPIFGGEVHKPSLDKIFYIPQRPYLPVGTLRDQIIYPQTPDEMKANGFTDKDLLDILDHVRLKYL